MCNNDEAPAHRLSLSSQQEAVGCRCEVPKLPDQVLEALQDSDPGRSRQMVAHMEPGSAGGATVKAQKLKSLFVSISCQANTALFVCGYLW